MLEGETLEEVKDFTYLGSIVDMHGGREADVKKRISKARVAFHLLRNVWKSKVIGETTKCKVRVAVWSRNVANKQDHTDKDPDICQPFLRRIL